MHILHETFLRASKEKKPEFLPKILKIFDETLGARSEPAEAHDTPQAGAHDTPHLRSDDVLKLIAPRLRDLDFRVESGKGKTQIIPYIIRHDPDGKVALSCNIDAYHDEWKCLIEVEAGRGWKSNAVHRDLLQAMVMKDVSHVILAVRKRYTWKGVNQNNVGSSMDYRNLSNLSAALYERTPVFRMPFNLTVIGY